MGVLIIDENGDVERHEDPAIDPGQCPTMRDHWRDVTPGLQIVPHEPTRQYEPPAAIIIGGYMPPQRQPRTPVIN